MKWVGGLLIGLWMLPAAGATYSVGQVVNDFALYARRPFTNDQGQIIAPGSPVRLSDFRGKIVFIEFFYVW